MMHDHRWSRHHQFFDHGCVATIIAKLFLATALVTVQELPDPAGDGMDRLVEAVVLAAARAIAGASRFFRCTGRTGRVAVAVCGERVACPGQTHAACGNPGQQSALEGTIGEHRRVSAFLGDRKACNALVTLHGIDPEQTE
jgi:hypothetical protein